MKQIDEPASLIIDIIVTIVLIIASVVLTFAFMWYKLEFFGFIALLTASCSGGKLIYRAGRLDEKVRWNRTLKLKSVSQEPTKDT